MLIAAPVIDLCLTEFKDIDANSESNIFEFSDYMWGLILNKSKVELHPIYITHYVHL